MDLDRQNLLFLSEKKIDDLEVLKDKEKKILRKHLNKSNNNNNENIKEKSKIIKNDSIILNK